MSTVAHSLCSFLYYHLFHVSCIFRPQLRDLGVNPHLLVMSTLGYLNDEYKDHKNLKACWEKVSL